MSESFVTFHTLKMALVLGSVESEVRIPERNSPGTALLRKSDDVAGRSKQSPYHTFCNCAMNLHRAQVCLLSIGYTTKQLLSVCQLMVIRFGTEVWIDASPVMKDLVLMQNYPPVKLTKVRDVTLLRPLQRV
jgi:hypothetical protein